MITAIAHASLNEITLLVPGMITTDLSFVNLDACSCKEGESKMGTWRRVEGGDEEGGSAKGSGISARYYLILGTSNIAAVHTICHVSTESYWAECLVTNTVSKCRRGSAALERPRSPRATSQP